MPHTCVDEPVPCAAAFLRVGEISVHGHGRRRARGSVDLRDSLKCTGESRIGPNVSESISSLPTLAPRQQRQQLFPPMWAAAGSALAIQSFRRQDADRNTILPPDAAALLSEFDPERETVEEPVEAKGGAQQLQPALPPHSQHR